MAMIRIPAFLGEVPRLSPRLLGPAQAQTAQDCRLSSGALAPWPAPAAVAPVGFPRPAKTIRTLPDGRWLAWPERVQTAMIPLAEHEGRLCFTGLDAPRLTEAKLAGPSGTMPGSRLLGVPAPASAPAASPGGGGAGTTPQSRAYISTFVSSRGEEGPPSPPSALIHALPGQQVTVYGLAPLPQGDWDIAARRIYRTATPTSGMALWSLVAEVPAAQTAFVDVLADADLGEELQSADWLPPPAGLRGVLAVPGGFLAGFVGNLVCFSEPYRPHAWPPGYRLSTEHPVAALGLFGSTLVAATTAQPYLLDGAHPAAMSLTRLPESQACVSEAGMAASEYGVVYPSPDGLYAVGPGGGRLITRQLMDRDRWQALRPETLCAAMHDGRYVAFFRDPEPDPWDWSDVGATHLGGALAGAEVNTRSVNGSRQDALAVPTPASLGRGLILDLSGPEPVLTFLNLYASAVASDTATDTLHLAAKSGQTQEIRAFGRGPAMLAYTWRSRIFAAQRPINLGAALVEADYASGTLEIAIVADGRERLRRSVADSRPFRLPAGFAAREWHVELRGTAAVQEIRLAGCVAELGN